jgi:metallo-beta-lactamase family protein
MKLTFHGAVGLVTGSNYLLESGGTTILIDCGMFQGSNFCERMNFDPFKYAPRDISAALITHAHIDHTGRLPKLYRDGFRGTIYSTPPTRDFAELLLIDSEHLIADEAKHFSLPPIYTTEDITKLMERWESIPYHEPFRVGPFKIEFLNAGHILGSSMITIEAEGKKIVFSGDLGNSPAPMIGMREKVTTVDFCVCESTYGDRLHEDLDMRRETLEDVIEDTVKSGGTLMIPAFAMERTQELLFEINNLAEAGRIPRVPIFIDSPLAIKLTAVYKKYESYYDEATRATIGRGDAIFNFPGLETTLTTEESKKINDVRPPKVVIAGSGMSNGGRILFHEQRYLPDPKSIILFIGYQSKGTLGKRILDGETVVKILGEEVPIRCKIKSIAGYSAHADQAQLLEWLSAMRLTVKKLFVVQGEEEASEALALKARDELAIEAIVPEIDKTYEL